MRAKKRVCRLGVDRPLETSKNPGIQPWTPSPGPQDPWTPGPKPDPGPGIGTVVQVEKGTVHALALKRGGGFRLRIS